jgi:hypothetical protein
MNKIKVAMIFMSCVVLHATISFSEVHIDDSREHLNTLRGRTLSVKSGTEDVQGRLEERYEARQQAAQLANQMTEEEHKSNEEVVRNVGR